jgi:hypothetical protein
MKKLFLIIPLATLLFATQGWAPPPGKGGSPPKINIPKEQPGYNAIEKGKTRASSQQNRTSRTEIINYFLKEYDLKYKEKLPSSSIEAFKSSFPNITSFPNNKAEKNKTLGIIKDWGSCRDRCWRIRDKCIRDGGSEHSCAAGYQVCTSSCDRNFLTTKELLGK